MTIKSDPHKPPIGTKEKKRLFNPFGYKTSLINGKEFVAWPPDEQSLKELADFHNTIAAKTAHYFSEENEGYWYYLNYFIYANYEFYKWPGLQFCLPLIRVLEDTKEGDTVTVKEGDSWGPTITKMIPKLYKNVTVVNQGRAKKNINFIFNTAFFLRQTIKTRILINYLVGLARRIMGIGREQRKAQAKVLFLENIRFIDKKTNKSQLYAGIQEELTKKRISQKTIIYAPFSEKVYLKRLLKEFIFDNRPFIGDYFRFKMFRKNKQFVKKMRVLWKKADADPAFRKLFTYQGRNFYSLIRPRFDILTKAIAYAAAENKNLTKSVIDKENYQVLVVDHEENQYAKGFMLNTKGNSKRKTVALSHELPGPGSNQTRPIDKESNNRQSVAWRPLMDKKFVWSEFMKKMFVKHNHYPRNVCTVTGNPRLDKALKNNANKESLFKKHTLDPKKQYILIASFVEHPHIETYIEIAKKNREYVWVIKPHPSRNMQFLIKAFSDGNIPENLVLKPNTTDINELITISEAVMVTISSVGAESAVLGKPLLFLNLGKWDFSAFKAVPYNVGIPITKIEQIPAALRAIKNPKKRKNIMIRTKQFADKFNYKHDGKASKRIATHIANLLS